MRRRLAALGAALGAAAVLASGLSAAAAPGPGLLQRDAAALHAAGAVGVAAVLDTPSGTQTAHSGTADLRTGAPVFPEAHYRAGSTTKTFIATVVLQLVGEGRLSLDDTVESRLPGLVSGNGNDGSRITIRQLLQHTSGLPNYTSVREVFPAGYSAAEYYAHRFRHYEAEELVAGAMRLPPRFEPGTDWAYSNTNYILAGLIIERVTGHSWEEEVRDRIIRPLGLTGTYAPGDDPVLPPPAVHGYHTYEEDGRTVDTTLFNATAADASGALISTPRDINRFFGALIGGRLLEGPELAEMLHTHPIPGEPGRGYGLGIETTPLSCGGFYWHHGGNALGYESEDGITVDGDRAVTVSVNSYDAADTARQDAVDAGVRTLIDDALCAGRTAD
ncbi:serine hydrolase domain-containing protein [Streptomyces hoynatensis]|uniref:Class A beta-lactamase-related serine hydrolase n=1 Tax=Streptomyces hoynatensis TaxID=1141874 RepID=A0A3A9ZFG6_9ACTN|nr:serine hydrolase domain-containing protein [Streptomyces hoynatensis]RKN46905.1 class A beta-lactamase-related serine hydrolase [Streptomyces hoynatensis]